MSVIVITLSRSHCMFNFNIHLHAIKIIALLIRPQNCKAWASFTDCMLWTDKKLPAMNSNRTRKTSFDLVSCRVLHQIEKSVRVVRKRCRILRLPAGVGEVRQVDLLLALLVVDRELSLDVWRKRFARYLKIKFDFNVFWILSPKTNPMRSAGEPIRRLKNS